MTLSEFSHQRPRQPNSFVQPVPRSRWRFALLTGMASLVALAIGYASFAASTGSWWQLPDHLQPITLWWQVPMVAVEYLFAPTIVLLLLAICVMKLSPKPQPWSRSWVVGTLLLLSMRYLLWRLTTLNLSDPLNSFFSLGLLGLELILLSAGSIQLFLMLRVRSRRREADIHSIAVITGKFTPTVDILIPTYNEPVSILRRTVIGCQALEYPAKTIYLLDDTQRSQVQDLAAELGCEYIARQEHHHAKAGNLNHAIAQSDGELIVVFDADFIPTRNFLTRTIGFFQSPEIGLVQTPQSFYNIDPVARNLGLENILTPEEEVFYRQIQPIRDAVGSIVCSGTSFVVRREALDAVGGFVTDSLSEDYFTGIRLAAIGYQLVYLDEKLSAGLAAENITAHAIQRLRWARGTLQAFFIHANPLTIPGLNLVQRLSHLEGLLHWFSSIARFGYLLIPMAYAFLGVVPIRTTMPELIYFFLPFYVINIAVFAWLNERSRSAFLSEIYSLVLVFPLAWTVIRVMLNPFGQGFQVTPKGTTRDRYSFNWSLAFPLILLFLGTAASLWQSLAIGSATTAWAEAARDGKPAVNLGWLWSSYNLIMTGIALLILIDKPKPDRYDWFDLRRTICLKGLDPRGTSRWGITTMMSEGGAKVALTQVTQPVDLPIGSALTVEIMEETLTLPAQIVAVTSEGDSPIVEIRFDRLSLAQERQLISLLFCRPGQWKDMCTPNEWSSLLLLFKTLLRPKVLCQPRAQTKPLAVTQT